jgi:PAS domain-containing protein
VTDITEKKRAEILSALEKSRFQFTIDEMDAAVFEWDLRTGAFYCSESYQKYAMSQVNPDDILHNTGSPDCVHPDDTPAMQKFIEDTANGLDRAETTLRLKMMDGSYRWCKMVGMYRRDEHGNPLNTIGIIIDVNEEHEKSTMLSSILNFMPGGVGVWKFGEVLTCEYYNDGFARMAGLSREEMDVRIANNTVLSSLIAPIDFPYVSQKIMELTSQGKPLDMTYRYLYVDGSIHWLQLAGVKLRDENGVPVYYCMFTSPTGEATMYRNMVEDSKVGVMVADMKDGNINYINEAAREYYEIPGDTTGSINILHHLELTGRKRLLTHEQLLTLEGYHRSAESKHPKCDKIKERTRWCLPCANMIKSLKKKRSSCLAKSA